MKRIIKKADDSYMDLHIEFEDKKEIDDLNRELEETEEKLEIEIIKCSNFYDEIVGLKKEKEKMDQLSHLIEELKTVKFVYDEKIRSDTAIKKAIELSEKDKDKFYDILEEYSTKKNVSNRLISVSSNEKVDFFDIIYDTIIKRTKINRELSKKIYDDEKKFINNFRSYIKRKMNSGKIFEQKFEIDEE